MMVVYTKDSLGYLETSLFPFPAQRGGVIRVYIGLTISPNRPQSNSSADFRTRKMNPELLAFPSSLVGGRSRPRRLFTDPFSSPIPSWGDVTEADSKAVPMAPLRQCRSGFFDDGPRSEIREGDLADIQRKYAIHPLVGMRSPSEFELAPDGGASEVAIYEAYLEAGFRGGIPFLIGEVSFFFGFCPSQLTSLTWRTLMAIQVLWELHGFSVGVHEIIYSYYFPSSEQSRVLSFPIP